MSSSSNSSSQPTIDLTYSPVEELVNTITHGTGLVASIAGFVFLLVYTILYGNGWHIAACSIYGGSLVSLYAASTLYHGCKSPRWKRIFRVADHACIYLLIAGSYTPFTLLVLEGAWGWSMFSVIWTFAAVGIIFKFIDVDPISWLTAGIYLVMGWLAVIAVYPLFQALPGDAFALLVAGGLTYSAGTIFYLWEKIPFNHGVWHVFVLAGSALHYFAVCIAALPG